MATMTNVSTEAPCSEHFIKETTSDADEPIIIINIAMGMLALLSVCGILGNSLVIFVFSRQKQKLSSTIFILTLAVTDFITSLITMPYTIAIELLEYQVEYDFLCKLYQFMKTTTIPFSAFVMVTIAVDRYLCIVYPFKHLMTIKRAKITVFLLSIFAFILGILCSLMTGTYEIYRDEGNRNCSQTYIKHVNYFHSNESMTGEAMQTDNAVYNRSGITYTGGKLEPGEIYSKGKCLASDLIFTVSFMKTYQKVYSSFFGVCAVMVVILYALTYRSVLTQRRKRFHLSNKCCGFLMRNNSEDIVQEQTEFTVLNEADGSPATNGNDRLQLKNQSFRERTETNESNSPGKANGKNQNDHNGHKHEHDRDGHVRPSGISRAKLKKLRVANIKTALMLSIVAFIYIVTFTPACLMALNLVPMNGIVYYMYFTYNVANPVIYAFLNQNFRTHLQTLFKCTA